MENDKHLEELLASLSDYGGQPFKMQGVQDTPSAQSVAMAPLRIPQSAVDGAKTTMSADSPIPQQATAPTPDVKDYISQKFNLGDYSTANRQKLVDEAGGSDWRDKTSAVLASLGAAFQGGNSVQAAQNALDRSAKAKGERINQFDKSRDAMLQEHTVGRNLQREGAEDDGNSMESKLAQTLAKKMVPTMNFEGMSATKINSQIPSLKGIYEGELKRMDIQSRDRDRAAMLGFKGREGQVAVDKDYAKDYNDFIGGGRDKAINAIKKLEDFYSEIEKDQGLFQSGGGPVKGSLPDSVRSQTSIARRDNTVSVANSALKGTFGSQLSDGERKALANEFYNDRLGNAENLKIMRRKINELKDSYIANQAKADYFQKNKQSLRGFQPPATRNRLFDESGGSAHSPGDIVKVKGTSYRVGADGDTLEEI